MKAGREGALPLPGKYNDDRDFHTQPDMILIYRELAEESLEFVRRGSYNELGL